MNLVSFQPTSSETFATVMTRFATELAGLAVLSDEMQEAFGAALTEEQGQLALQADALHSMQNLDLLTQTLDALARFATVLSGSGDLRGKLDLSAALAAVPLSALAARLGGFEQDVSETEFDLF